MPVSFLTFEAVVQYILLVSSVPAAAANIVVVICAYKLLRQSGDTMHIFVISTALADLVVTAFHHPYLLLALRHRLPSQAVACAITQSIELVGMAVSGISVTFLNADKFIFFRWPLKYLTLSWRRSVVLSFVAVGLIVVGVALMWIFHVVFIGRDEICAFKTPNESGALAAYEVFVILFCLAPVASSLLLSIYLFQLTRRRRIRTAASSLGGNASALKCRAFRSDVFTPATQLMGKLRPWSPERSSEGKALSEHSCNCILVTRWTVATVAIPRMRRREWASSICIGTGRPEFSQYEKAFKLHTGRTLTWYAIEQGFRSVLAMLREVDGLLVTEDGGKTYVQKKRMEDGEDLHNVPQDP